MAIAPEIVTPAPSEPSLWRAWWNLVVLSMRRQARARVMVLIAIGLIAFAAAMTAVWTALDAWHWPRYQRWIAGSIVVLDAALPGAPNHPIPDPFYVAARAIVSSDDWAFVGFYRWIVSSIFLAFLLPICCLSFATEALGGEREGGTLIWLLARPLPRSLVYLAKFVALLPWAVGLGVGGFGVLCLAGGAPGVQAFRLFWPAVLCATLTFSSLFHLMAACSRWPAVVAIGYSFFLEILLGNMPGYLKRVSIGFYARCMMFEAAESLGVQPEKPSVYLPVDGATAATVLLTAAAALLVIGMVVFSRMQYRDGV